MPAALLMATEKINPESLAKPHGYAQAIAATGTRFVFTSGQTPIDKDGELVGAGPDYRAQGRQAAANVYAAVTAAGASARDIVRLTIYVVDPSDANLDELYAGLGEAGKDAGAKATATSLIGVAAIAVPGAMVEIEATALVD
jgi:enamine deaminase RidA (YjgF/YER057c/UK114 family)